MTDLDQKFEETLKWIAEEERLRKERGQGISSSYLIIMSIMIICLMVFIVYLMNNHGTEFEALEMMQDSDNFYGDEEYSENYVSEYEASGEIVDDIGGELPPLEVEVNSQLPVIPDEV